jgi:hypothetical protein
MLTSADVCRWLWRGVAWRERWERAWREPSLSSGRQAQERLSLWSRAFSRYSRMLTYAHVCSRMLTYAHVCSLLHAAATARCICVSIRQHTSAYVSIRQHTSACTQTRSLLHTAATTTAPNTATNVLRRHCAWGGPTYADVCLRMLTYGRMLTYADAGTVHGGGQRMLTYADVC